MHGLLEKPDLKKEGKKDGRKKGQEKKEKKGKKGGKRRQASRDIYVSKARSSEEMLIQ